MAARGSALRPARSAGLGGRGATAATGAGSPGWSEQHRRRSERGATLTEYGLILTLLVVSAIGIIGRLQDESGSYLIETGEDIGTPRELAADIDPDLPEPPAWLSQPPPPTTEATTTTTAATTTSTTTGGPTTEPPTTPAPTSSSTSTSTTAPPTTVSPATPGTLFAAYADKCLETDGASTADNAQIRTAECSGALHQTFLVRSAGGGNVELVTGNAGKCIQPLGGATGPATVLVQGPCNGSPTTLWTYATTPAGLEFTLSGTSMCIDVYGAGTAAGLDMIIWSCHGGANQSFEFDGIVG